LQSLVRQDVELQIELLIEFILPLLDQTPRRNDEAARHVATDDQFLHQQASHDCLACAGIVREQEAERLPIEHRLVNRSDLVGQRIDAGRVDGDERVEQEGESQSLCLGCQPEQGAV
jgi:hypothetical protein